jgi:hypothetical protein
LNAAAVEVNQVFNYCNEMSFATAIRTDSKRKWLTGFDLCNLTAGATEYLPLDPQTKNWIDRLIEGMKVLATNEAERQKITKKLF